MPPLLGFAFTNAALRSLEKIPPKFRAQIIKRAKALHLNPYPQGVEKLKGKSTKTGESLYRERSGDYRIVYVVRENPSEVLILDIGPRGGIYKMKSEKKKEDGDLRMKAGDFDDMMRRALGASPKQEPSSPRLQRKPTKAKPRAKPTR